MILGAVGLSLLAAVGFAAGSVITKHLVGRFRFDQLIGPAFGFNAMWLLPLTPFLEWRWSWTIVGLHVASIAAICATAWAIFDLFRHGAASAVTTAQSTSPLAAALGVALFVPDTFSWVDTIVAVVIVIAVMAALADSFPAIGPRRASFTGAVIAAGTGFTTVLARLLVDEGVGIVEIYVTRTVVAAAVFLIAIPPRDLGRPSLPGLIGRSAIMTASWMAALAAVRVGSPTVVQTMAATTPLWVLGWESVRSRRPPPPRVLVAAGLVLLGVVVISTSSG